MVLAGIWNGIIPTRNQEIFQKNILLRRACSAGVHSVSRSLTFPAKHLATKIL